MTNKTNEEFTALVTDLKYDNSKRVAIDLIQPVFEDFQSERDKLSIASGFDVLVDVITSIRNTKDNINELSRKIHKTDDIKIPLKFEYDAGTETLALIDSIAKDVEDLEKTAKTKLQGQ